jgi:phosphatidylinositol alpha-mannosyltransferase
MNARLPKSRLIIVGDGPLRGQVESYISRHRLPNVVMAGFVPDTVLPRYYCSADIFCAPATGAESFGIVLLEALASGLPVVATEVEGYMSVLEPGRDSLTVQPKGWAELGSALIILARDADLRRRMGAFGREKASRFGWDVVAAQILEVYEEAREAAAGREAQAAHIEEINVHDAV